MTDPNQAPARPSEVAVLSMILPCPRCRALHVDAPEPEKGWTNPPHKSHLCHYCGLVWRPADVPTNGVAAIATNGKDDNWKPGAADHGAAPSMRSDDKWDRIVRDAYKDEDPRAAGGDWHRDCMPRDVVEQMLATKLPCGHPEACAIMHDEQGAHMSCGWCDAVKGQKEIADMACEHAESAETREYKVTQPLQDMIEQLEKELEQAEARVAELEKELAPHREVEAILNGMQAERTPEEVAMDEEQIRRSLDRVRRGGMDAVEDQLTRERDAAINSRARHIAAMVSLATTWSQPYLPHMNAAGRELFAALKQQGGAEQPAPRGECAHGDGAMMWNPYNAVTQCHKCGEVDWPATHTHWVLWLKDMREWGINSRRYDEDKATKCAGDIDAITTPRAPRGDGRGGEGA